MKRLLYLIALLPALCFGQANVQQKKAPASGSSEGNQFYQWYGVNFAGYMGVPFGQNATLNRASDMDGLVYFQLTDKTIRLRLGGQWVSFGGGSAVDSVLFFNADNFYLDGKTDTTPISIRLLNTPIGTPGQDSLVVIRPDGTPGAIPSTFLGKVGNGLSLRGDSVILGGTLWLSTAINTDHDALFIGNSGTFNGLGVNSAGVVSLNLISVANGSIFNAGSYNIDNNASSSYYEIDESVGSVTINLPSVVTGTSGRIYTFKRVTKTGGNTVTIVPFSGETIDGSGSNISLPNQWDWITILANNDFSGWDILSRNTSTGTTASLTMNNSGAGDASGTTFNGSTARTISYNTIGAVPTSRTVSTSTGLTGGGALSANLTLKADTTVLQTIANFHPLGNTFWVPLTRTVNGKALSSNITLGLASADFANQGTTTTVLHGNASGNPSFGAVVLTTDVSGTLPVGNGGTGVTSLGVLTLGRGLTGSSYSPAANTTTTLDTTVKYSFQKGLILAGNPTEPAWGNNTATSSTGADLSISAKTITDNSTAGSTTISNAFSNAIYQPTFAATNSSVTYTNAATLAILNAPAAGTNVTLSNPLALYVVSGASVLAGGLSSGTGGAASNFSSSGGTGMSSSTNSQLLPGGVSTINYRAVFGGTTSTSITSGNSAANVIVGSHTFTTANSSTTAYGFNFFVNKPGTYTKGSSATITNTATVGIWGQSTAGTNNYNLLSYDDQAAGTTNAWFKYGVTRVSALKVDSLLTGTAGTDAFIVSHSGTAGTISASLIPLTQASADLTAQTSAGNITTFTVGASTATFNISAYLNITAVSTDVIQVQVTYTDENSNSQTVSFTTLSSISNSTYSPVTIRAKNGTVITVKSNLTVGAGSITFDCGARITQL